MNTKDKVFLARTDAVTETYQKRIAKLQDRLAQVEADIILDTRGWKRVIDGLDTLNRLEKLQAEQQQHTQRVRELREQQRQTAAIKRLRALLGRVQGRQAYGKAVAQVKGGTYTLGHIRDFRTAMQNTEADVGVFVVTTPPTRGMLTEATRAGTYRYPFLDMEIPVLQIYEIQNHFRDTPPKLPFGERAVL